MLTTVDRVFVKRTRRGQVKTHVRQHYLRDDLPSGSPHLDAPGPAFRGVAVGERGGGW